MVADIFEPKSILVTGGCGFIGSCFIRQVLAMDGDVGVVNLDALTYAGNPDNLCEVEQSARYTFAKGDICDGQRVEELLQAHDVDCVVHFAAESHVDRSITGPSVFLETNVIGTHTLLQQSLAYGGVARFVAVSTDEVYGALALDSKELFHEQQLLEPNSPYSSSKAGADLVARAYFHTYGLPVLITRASNNYGPYQFPEKLIPLIINNALHDESLPVYGDGLYVRDWLHVSDHCRGIWSVLTKGRVGEVYNIGGNNERANIDVVKMILAALEKPESLIEYVKDRPGHDRRYAIDCGKLIKETGWAPEVDFVGGIRDTIEWYRGNGEWLDRIASGAYQQ